MPITEKVKFLALLQKLNRVQIPVEVRWRYKLEAGELLKVEVQPIGHISAGADEFIARLLSDGRITVPWEIMADLGLGKKRYLLRVWLKPK